MLERRNGSAPGIYNRLREDGRFVNRAILNEAQYCLSTLLNNVGLAAYRMAFRSIPADLYSRQDNYADFDFAQHMSVTNQFRL